MNYSNHVGIIGSGISGLTLGCCLLKFGIDCVIFEKSNEISKHGAGISISRNALKILDRLDLIIHSRKNRFNQKKFPGIIRMLSFTPLIQMFLLQIEKI